MKIYLKQEEKDIREDMQLVLKKNNTDLAKACRKAGVDYKLVYRNLNKEYIDYEWLCQTMAELAPGVELVLDL
jgi:lambda repressor-like predicted transcriptional regulator